MKRYTLPVFLSAWLLLAGLLLLAACRPQPADSAFLGPVPEGALARLGKGQMRDIAFAPGGETLYVAGETGLSAYDSRSLAAQWQLATAVSARRVLPSPDGRWLLAGLDDGALLLLDAAEGRLVESWPGYSDLVSVSAIAWQPAGDEHGLRAVAGYEDGNMLLINVAEDGVQTIGGLPRQDSGITALAFNSDGRILASGNRNGLIHLIDLGEQMLLITFEEHERRKAIESIAWSPGGDGLLSGDSAGVIIEWDLNEMAPAHIWPAEGQPILSVSYLDGGERLAMATAGGQLEQWAAGQLVDGARSAVGMPLTAVAWDPAGNRYATAGADGALLLWPLPDSGAWAAGPQETLPGYAPDAGQVAVVAYDEQDGRVLSNLGDLAIVWDPLAGQRLATYAGHEHPIVAGAWSPDGRQIATAGRDGAIHIWEAAGGDLVTRLDGHTRAVGGLAWSPDGAQLASTGSLDDELLLWDVRSGRIEARLSGEGDGLWAVGFSPDGRSLAAGSTGGKLFIWSTEDLGAPPEELWRHQSWISDLAWYGDGQRLLSGGGDALLVQWDLAQRNSSPLPGHNAPVRGLALHPDGARAVSAAVDGAVHVWDTSPRAADPLLDVLRGHTEGATAVDWSPNGRYIATGSEDGSVIIWPAQGQD